MALSGDIETMPLADVLQFLGLARKTGILRLELGRVRKQIYLEDGRAVFCSSGGAKEYIGQHLLARTSLTEQDLDRALALQRESGRKLGEIIVTTGLLTQADLDSVLRHKVEDSIYDVFTWSGGRFEFEEAALSDDDMPVRLSLGWQDIVMEGARRSDEMVGIRAVVAGPHVRLHARPERFPPDFPRTSGDKKIIDLVGEGLTAGDICAHFHASDFDVMSRLKVLVESGVLDVDAASLENGRPLTRRDVLRVGTERMERGDLVAAWETFRDGAEQFVGDEGILSGLATCEQRLRRMFAATMGDFSAIPVLRVTLEHLATQPLSSKQAFVATRITGDWSVRSIAQVCPFDEIEALCIIDSLVRQGLIELKIPVTR